MLALEDGGANQHGQHHHPENDPPHPARFLRTGATVGAAAVREWVM